MTLFHTDFQTDKKMRRESSHLRTCSAGINLKKHVDPQISQYQNVFLVIILTIPSSVIQLNGYLYSFCYFYFSFWRAEDTVGLSICQLQL